MLRIINALLVCLLITMPLSVYAFNPTQLAQFEKTNKCPGCDLSNANLNFAQSINHSGADLRGANLTGIQASVVNFSEANLQNVNLTNGQFLYSDFSESNLTGAILTGANFPSANLFKAIVTASQLEKACLLGAIMPNGQTNSTIC